MASYLVVVFLGIGLLGSLASTSTPTSYASDQFVPAPSEHAVDSIVVPDSGATGR